MMHRFDEHHPEFAGFSDYFERHLAPGLREREGERAQAHRRGLLLAGAALATGVAVIIVLVFAHIRGQAVFAAAVLSLLAAAGGYAALTSGISRATKDMLLGGVFGYDGWTFQAEVEAFAPAPWSERGLIPSRADRTGFEDAIGGEAHGAHFQSVEAHLEVRVKNGYSTIFRGQLIRLTLPRPLGMGETVVLRDKGLFNRKRRGDMKRVGLVDPQWERLFEAYSTDQVGARVVLDPAFMARMVDLEAALDGKNIRYAFFDRTMLIAVETGDLYEAGSMGVPLDDPARAQRILDEAGAVFDLVDGLLGRPTSPA